MVGDQSPMVSSTATLASLSKSDLRLVETQEAGESCKTCDCECDQRVKHRST